jgi:hypothetical protein
MFSFIILFGYDLFVILPIFDRKARRYKRGNQKP